MCGREDDPSQHDGVIDGGPWQGPSLVEWIDRLASDWPWYTGPESRDRGMESDPVPGYRPRHAAEGGS